MLGAHCDACRSILHDESAYPDPFEFRPERYLDENGKLRKLGKAEEPTVAAFGFGRRSASFTRSGAAVKVDPRIIFSAGYVLGSFSLIIQYFWPLRRCSMSST
jgi:hypothetical protein